MGNIEFPDEATACSARGAEGVGLYRTEFLYVGRNTDPSEEEHFRSYLRGDSRDGRGSAGGHPHAGLGARTSSCPFTGRRNRKRTPLSDCGLSGSACGTFRCFARSAGHPACERLGDVRIMFPMVSTLPELRKCLFLMREVMEDLREEQVKFNPNLPVGTMIEVPSAAVMAEEFAREVDFFSIGERMISYSTHWRPTGRTNMWPTCIRRRTLRCYA